jgi:hypothetical protein
VEVSTYDNGKLRATHTVEMNDDEEVTVRMPRWEALALAQIVLAAVGQHSTHRLERQRLNGLAHMIARTTRPKAPLPPKKVQRTMRPSSVYRSEFDIDHVLNGSPPFPVLSLKDMDEVYPLLEKREHSAAEIGARLYVTPRTVVRWRTEGLKRWKEEE